MKRHWLVMLIPLVGTIPPPADAQVTRGTDRLYVLDCGHGTAPNQGRFSPGYNDGKPFELTDNCYLIHHPQGYLLWGRAFLTGFCTSRAACRPMGDGRIGS
jgi:N-acyl homoserine lactone hydrolase